MGYAFNYDKGAHLHEAAREYILNSYDELLLQYNIPSYAQPEHVLIHVHNHKPNSFAQYNYETDTITIHLDHDVATTEKHIMANHQQRYLVARTLMEVVLHELGHCQHYHTDPVFYTHLQQRSFAAWHPIEMTPRLEELIAQHISIYATTKPREFIAELFVFEHLYPDRQLPEELNELASDVQGLI